MAGDKKSVIKDLIEQGKAKGKVTTKELNDALEELDFDVEQVDKLYDTLDANNIEIIEDFAPASDGSFDTMLHENEDLETVLSAEGISRRSGQVYLKEIGRVPLLTSEEEVELAIRMAKGDLTPENVCLRPICLVVSIAKKYVGRGMQFLDLIQEETWA
ncbi:MAG: sigma-70 factor domain-containing protein [Oscillospiraceae bacterium]